MSTITANPLNDTLQALVDARLDTIDRMLIGRVNRQDRLAIVREVESQIFDLLSRQDGEVDRDDVLAVLARLDPPEAYLPDEDAPVGVSRARVATPSAPKDGQEGRTALAGGILGMIALMFFAFCFLDEWSLANWLGGAAIPLFIVSMGLSFVTGILAIVFAARVRLQGAWAVVGLVTGLISMLLDTFFGLLLLANS